MHSFIKIKGSTMTKKNAALAIIVMISCFFFLYYNKQTSEWIDNEAIKIIFSLFVSMFFSKALLRKMNKHKQTEPYRLKLKSIVTSAKALQTNVRADTLKNLAMFCYKQAFMLQRLKGWEKQDLLKLLKGEKKGYGVFVDIGYDGWEYMQASLKHNKQIAKTFKQNIETFVKANPNSLFSNKCVSFLIVSKHKFCDKTNEYKLDPCIGYPSNDKETYGFPKQGAQPFTLNKAHKVEGLLKPKLCIRLPEPEYDEMEKFPNLVVNSIITGLCKLETQPNNNEVIIEKIIYDKKEGGSATTPGMALAG